MGDTKTLLRKAADEMRKEDQNGWPLVCDIAVEALASHEARIAELEGLLANASLQIKYLHEKFHVTGSGNGVIAIIDRALHIEEDK